DSEIGENGDGLSEGIVTYLWPEDAFDERPNGGLLKIILDYVEKNINAENRIDLESLRYQANSSYYSDNKVFSIDEFNKRVYVPDGIAVKARIISVPKAIDDNDQYGAGVESISTLPISEAFQQTLSELSFQELIKTVQNYANRERVLEDSGVLKAQQPEEQNG